MKHGRSYLMDECGVMAPGRERAPTTVIPALGLSSYRRKQASPGTNDKSAPRFLNCSLAPCRLAAAGFPKTSAASLVWGHRQKVAFWKRRRTCKHRANKSFRSLPGHRWPVDVRSPCPSVNASTRHGARRARHCGADRPTLDEVGDGIHRSSPREPALHPRTSTATARLTLRRMLRCLSDL